MLLKRAFQPRLPLSLTRRYFLTLPNTNIKVGDNLQRMVDFLAMENSFNTYTVIFFKAAWNPKCEETLENYKEVAAKHGHFAHFVVDCDENQRIQLYFGARYQPQFLVLLNGSTVYRMIGYDMKRLADVLERVHAGHIKEFNYLEGSKDLKQKFFEEHDRYIRQVEAGRDVRDNVPESLEKDYLTFK